MVRRGYTLTEVLISIILISTIFAISIPLYYRMARVLPSEAKLTSISQKLFFLLSDARKRGFLGSDVVCIKYSNRTFEAFIDNDLNGVSDDGQILSKFDFTGKDYENVVFTFNNQQVNQITDLYTTDGIFAKKLSGNVLDLVYSNATFQFTLEGKTITIRLENSLPKIIE